MARVLVIDDEDIIGTILSIALPHHAVVSAHDGEEGLVLLEAAEPDVIVLDLMMPVLDGYAVLKTVRDDLHLRTPILVLTAVGNRDDLGTCLAAGASQVMTKPFDPHEVAHAIDDLLASAAV